MKTIIAVFVAACFWSASAIAHTELSSSTPADEAIVGSAPEQATLVFSEAVRLTAVALQSISGRQALDLDAPEFATEFVVALPALMPGEYVIEWRALSEDTHVMTGEIRFTVAS